MPSMDIGGVTGDELLGLAESIVAKAMAAGNGADQAEVYMERGTGIDVEVEKDHISAASTGRTAGGSIRIVKDGRLGFAYFTSPEDAGKAIDRALAHTRLAPNKGYRLPSDHGAPAELPTRWDADMAGMPADVAVAAAQGAVEALKEACPGATVGGGGVSIGAGIEAITSSEGIAAWDGATHSSVGLSALLADGDRSISAWDSASAHLGRPDGSRVGAGLGRTIASLADPRPAVSGTNDILFLPDAGSELVSGVVSSAVDGDRAKRGRSVWSDALGTQVANDGLTITDDPLRADAIGVAPFDGEGLPARRVPIIASGRLETFLFDSWDAHEHGEQMTHHAVRGGFRSLPGTGSQHMVIEHQNTMSLDALVGGMEAGYLVESVLGAHTANATTGDFSVTAANVWRIEDGAVAGASSEVAIAGNLPDLLKGLDGASDAPKAMDGARIPALRFRDVSVSA